MSKSRAESQNPSPYGRKRSNTVQSSLKSPQTPATPLGVGDATVLMLWVHDPEKGMGNEVSFNADYWPGVSEGDMLRVTAQSTDEDEVRIAERDGFLFIVQRQKDEARLAPNMQLSVPKPIADAFGLRNHNEVKLTKVDRSKMCADYLEIVFQDQYLGRCDMWRLGKQLQGQCVHIGQEVTFVGAPLGKIQNIYINGKNVSAGFVTALTKSIFRSLTAKVTIFIQVCRELWEFAGDGERYNEKIVHSFLPALFRRWRDAGTNHIVTIVLISRVFYEDSETSYAAGPLQQNDEGRWYKDFFKVITDLEVVQDWKPRLVSLKDSFTAFQRDILLTHHYHRPTSDSNLDEVRLVGRISFAHEGPLLEAINLTLNPIETLYVDRSFSVTGIGTIVITPGTGYYRVTKRLLRMTTTRLLDQGFGVDLVSLTKPPLHKTPIFSFAGYENDLRTDMEKERDRSGGRSNDPLWGGLDDDGHDASGREKITFWWEPFWISMSFWEQQMDLPFRGDRFIACAKMHQIEMLGLLEHDVLSSIHIKYLTDDDSFKTTRDASPTTNDMNKEDAEIFDLDRFASRKLSSSPGFSRESVSSSVTTVVDPGTHRPQEKRPSYILQRSATSTPRIAPIEESPRHIYKELPPEGEKDTMSVTGTSILSTSPSHSMTSNAGTSRQYKSEKEGDRQPQPQQPTPSRASLGSKLTSSWLFNPFRSALGQPQPSAAAITEVSSVTVSASSSTSGPRTPSSTPPQAQSMALPMPSSQARSPRPMAIRPTPSRRSVLSQRSEEEILSSRGSYPRRSPSGASPRDDVYIPRRSTIASLNFPLTASSPIPRTNPLRTNDSIPYNQTSLASRWQHMFPQPSFKHQIKWKSMVTPGCLPLTTEYFPTKSELESSYDVFTYEFLVVPPEMKSFLVRNPFQGRETAVWRDGDRVRQVWALAVMREMAALRVVQGFQFVVRPPRVNGFDGKQRRAAQNFCVDDQNTPKPAGASEIFANGVDPVFLSMSNEIHRISYNGESIQVRRYVRRMPPTRPFVYKCLVWPKLGVGYTELATSFGTNGLESYYWNRLDMLIAGYEHQFSESLRYWRTRFLVIPASEPSSSIAPTSNEKGLRLNEEEMRLVGSDKLAELFTKLRWIPPGERADAYPPVRFLPTYLEPSASVLDEQLVAQLEEIQAAGPLGKKMKSERDIAEMNLTSLAKAMREEASLGIKDHKWHTKVYQDSFTGYEFVSWLVREFRDVSTREQGADWGQRLLEQGLIEHCRGLYPLLDGHYFYRLKSPYAVPSTPRSGRWFRPTRHVVNDEKEAKTGHYPGTKSGLMFTKRSRKRLVLSQSIVVDVDPQKKSDQAEIVVLHYDLIHNPANVLHIELNWLGTTARCIDDMLRLWMRTIERYGLRLVEAYVGQIANVRDRNPFQSCFPVRLALPPPVVPDLERRLAASSGSTPNAHYFEYALLRKFGFVLDIEAGSLYPNNVDVYYTYRRDAFDHAQFVHRSGAAFVQVLGGAAGFLVLTNRLVAPSRFSAAGMDRDRARPAEEAERIRTELARFCDDRNALEQFYDERLAKLPPPGPEEPPPLSI